MVFRLLGLFEPGLRKVPTLETERLILRGIQAEDYVDWARLRRDSRDFLQPWEPLWPRDHLSPRSFRRRVRWARSEARRGNGYAFLIEHRAERRLVGGLTLSNIRLAPSRTGVLGYWVGRPYIRNGYASEAVDRAVQFAFEQLDLRRVEAACLEENAASRALLRACGFAYEGVVRAYLEVNGTPRDHLLFAKVRQGR